MKQQIHQLLLQSPNLTGREIAQKIGAEKKDVNSFLSKNLDIFQKNESHQWQVKHPNTIIIEFGTTWIDSQTFERSLAEYPDLFSKPDANIKFIIPDGCKLLLEAIAKFLALLNQLVHNEISVSIDLCECKDTKGYLNRVGFFDQLNSRIKVFPSRPTESAAKKYKNGSNSLVEFGFIDPQDENKILKIQLGTTFTKNSDNRYEVAARTTFAELIGNVGEHSQSAIRGFAALQAYSPPHKSKHIQAVISDSGLGISTTLRSTLQVKHPHLYQRFGNQSIETDIGLVIEAFSKGEISRFGEGRGLGFKSSRENSTKSFDANLSVRQETFNVEFIYRNGLLQDQRIDRNLSKIYGTHICFDFIID